MYTLITVDVLSNFDMVRQDFATDIRKLYPGSMTYK